MISGNYSFHGSPFYPEETPFDENKTKETPEKKLENAPEPATKNKRKLNEFEHMDHTEQETERYAKKQEKILEKSNETVALEQNKEIAEIAAQKRDIKEAIDEKHEVSHLIERDIKQRESHE